MKLSCSGMRDAIAAVLPGAHTAKAKSVNEAFDLVVFTGKHVVTYNDRVSVSYPYVTDFNCAVNAADINSVLKGIRDPEVEVTIDGNDMHIVSDSVDARLTLSASADSLLDIVDKLGASGRTFSPVPKDFLDGVKICLFSVSRQASSRVLTCVSIDGSIINSSDDLRISDYTMSEPFDENPFLLPATTCSDLLRYDVKEYCLDGTWIHFRTSHGTIFSCQVVLDEYPNTDPLFEVDGEAISLPKELKEAAEHVASMTEAVDEGMMTITVRLTSGLITVEGKKARGTLDRKIAYPEYDGPDVVFTSHPAFITDVLDKSTTVRVGERVALFEAGAFRHVIALRT